MTIIHVLLIPSLIPSHIIHIPVKLQGWVLVTPSFMKGHSCTYLESIEQVGIFDAMIVVDVLNESLLIPGLISSLHYEGSEKMEGMEDGMESKNTSFVEWQELHHGKRNNHAGSSSPLPLNLHPAQNQVSQGSRWKE